MAQETLKSLIAVIMTLPLNEQKQVVSELQANIDRQTSEVDPEIRRQLIASVEEGEAEIERGEYYTHEEVLEMMKQRIESKYAVAV